MEERPILFNAEMVRAVLDGRKTQTRRIVKGDRYLDGVAGVEHKTDGFLDSHGNLFKCPYGKPGDELYVKETHFQWGYWVVDTVTGQKSFSRHGDKFAMYADSPPEIIANRNTPEKAWHKRPSLFMPRWASRIQLRITDIRVERVQDISTEDARDEGTNPGKGPVSTIIGDETGYQNCFRTLWNSINEKRGYGWDKNPWVWVVEFEVVK